ncbi:MAG: DUF5108 domain-containing protein [Bacteroidales bacterium]|nr:DUF5108 domain-containing protein [Bacteroidales bacterium]
MNKVLYVILLMGLSLSLASCDKDLWKLEDDSKGSYKPTDGDPISTTLENSGEFTEWIKVLNYTETYSILNAMFDGSNKGHKYTVFAPTDEALFQFYRQKGVNGIEALGKDYATALVKTMTYDGDSLKLTEVFSSDVASAAYANEAGEYLYITVNTEGEGFLMSSASDNAALVLSRNYIKCSNGFVYTAEGVLNPLVETVYDRVAESSSSIMLEALKATGYDKQLATVADTTYVLGARKVTRRYYTLLNVTDDAFALNGINSLADLKNASAANTSDASVGQDSLLKQYVQYHLFETNYTVADLSAMVGSDSIRIWETAAPNQILMIHRHLIGATEVLLADGTTGLDTLYCISFNDDNDTYQKQDIPYYGIETLTSSQLSLLRTLENVTVLLTDDSNIIAKNGYVHNLSDWMPVYEPKQSTVVWDLADYAEVRNALGDIYQPSAAVTSETKSDLSRLSCYTVEQGPDGSGNNSYTSLCYVTCKANLKNCLNFDRVVFNVGYQGSVTMKTPTLVKGKYQVKISMAYLTEQSFIRTSNGCKGGMMRLTVDGENQILTAPYTTITKSLAGVYETVLYDELEFSETASHEFKFVILDPAASTNSKFSLQFDAITFTPIE